MLYFFSFCCFIGKQTKDELLFATKLLIKSMDTYIKKYEFLIFTNFDLQISNPNVKIEKYYNHPSNVLLYKNASGWDKGWKDLSMNKIYIFKDLYKKFKVDFIWIDLDTYIFNNLSYLEQMDNFFIDYGGENKTLMPVATNFKINFHNYIQGNIWKLNIDLCEKLLNLLDYLKKKNIRLLYDSQSLFTYYFYKILNGRINEHKINIIGNNVYPNILNGLAIWCPKKERDHASVKGLNNLYIDNEKLKSKFHPNKEIHIVSFTFFTLIKIRNENYFKKIFKYDNNIIEKKKHNYFVCSFGGSGSKILTSYLENFGNVFHIHSRNPPNELTKIGKSTEKEKNKYCEWFTDKLIPSNELNNYTVIYLYRDPIKAILSKFHIPNHLRNIQCSPSIKLDDVINHNKDLYMLEDFFDNYVFKQRKYNIICVKYEQLFENIKKLNKVLNIPNNPKLYPIKIEKKKPNKININNGLEIIYKNLKVKMDKLKFIHLNYGKKK